MRNLLFLLVIFCSLIAATLAAREVNINRQYIGKRLVEMQDDEHLRHFKHQRPQRKHKWRKARKRTLSSVISKLKALLNFERDETLVEKQSFNTKTKDTKTRFQQTYKGIPVFDTVVTASQTDLTDVIGHIWQDIDSDVTTTTPTLTAEQAFQKAKETEGDNGNGVSDEQKTLLIYTNKEGKAYLAYEVNYFFSAPSSGEYKRPYYVIDARRGKVLHSWQGLTTAGTRRISFQGGNELTKKQPREIMVKESGADCTLETDQVKAIVHMDGAPAGSTTLDHPPYKFTCSAGLVETKTNGAYAPLGDAMAFAADTARMYKEWMGLEPEAITKNGIRVFVHVKPGPNDLPAFWNFKGAHFSDGDKKLFPAIVLDAVAHEISHGFTEKYSDLMYDRTESGAINEAFSDIGGEAAEMFIKGAVDWKVAAEIVKSRTQAGVYYLGRSALRYFENPSKDGDSINTADQHTGDLKQHYGSGPYRLAFYKLVNVQNWDFVEAFKVFAKANMFYWRRRTNYVEGLCCLRAAANDLFGADARRQNDLTAAFALAKISGCEDYGRETLLQMNVETAIGAISKGQTKSFEFFIPAHCKSLTIKVKDGRGKLVIYERRDSPAGDQQGEYDHSATGSGTVQLVVNSELYTKKSPASHFIMVKASEDISGYNIMATFAKAK